MSVKGQKGSISDFAGPLVSAVTAPRQPWTEANKRDGCVPGNFRHKSRRQAGFGPCNLYSKEQTSIYCFLKKRNFGFLKNPSEQHETSTKDFHSLCCSSSILTADGQPFSWKRQGSLGVPAQVYQLFTRRQDREENTTRPRQRVPARRGDMRRGPSTSRTPVRRLHFLPPQHCHLR